jgi:dihydroorotate dehydrogenase
VYWRKKMKGNLFELPVRIGGITLRNPLVVASGPTVKSVEKAFLKPCRRL